MKECHHACERYREFRPHFADFADEGFEEIVARHLLRVRGIGEVIAVGVCLCERMALEEERRLSEGTQQRTRGRAVILQSFRSANTTPSRSTTRALSSGPY